MAIGTLIHFFDNTAVIPNNGNSYNYDQNEGSNDYESRVENCNSYYQENR